MHKLTLYTVCCLAIVLQSCAPTEENVSTFKNGSFKIVVRSREFHHSGSPNVDVCMAKVSDRRIQVKKAECFLNGYDFSGLSVRWLSARDIEISFRCGTVSEFRNYAFVYPRGSVPVEFHAILSDHCRESSDDAGGEAPH